MQKRSIFMQVTKDRYELPMAVADSAEELAQMLGYRRSNIDCYAAKHQCGIVRVEVYEDDDECCD